MVGSGRGIIDRNQSFKKRSGNIFKKAHELAVLCDIMVCAVIVGPNGEIETRPQNQIKAINLFKQFKDNKNTIFDSANFIANGAAEEGKRKTNKKKKVAQEAIKSKKLDFSFFDDNLVDGLSPKSVLEIRKILKSKIEAARNRVEFFKSKTGKYQESLAVTGFEINPTPNFNQPIFNYSEMMLDFPARNRVEFLKSKTAKDQEFEINPTPNYDEPIFSYSEMMLDFPARNRAELSKTGKDQESRAGSGFEINPTPNYDQPIFNYSEMMLGFLPPQLNLSGLEHGLNKRFPECAYAESQKQVGATDLENNWNPNFGAGSGGVFREDSGNWLGTALNSLPPNNWNPNFDSQMVYQDGYFHNSNHRNAGSGGVFRNDSGNWLGTGMNSLPPPPAGSSIRVPDCRFGSGSALPLEQMIGILQPSPLEVGASMASTPLQPLTQQQLNWWFS